VEIPDCWIARKLGAILSVSGMPAATYQAMANDFFDAGKKDTCAFFESACTSKAWTAWKEGRGKREALLEIPFQRPHGSRAYHAHRDAVPDDRVYAGIVQKFYSAGVKEAIAAVRDLSRNILENPTGP
jgi:hypothetical protein